MNDEQRFALLRTLAASFDRAAVNCGHKDQAARFILADLEAAGFKVQPRKTPRDPRPIRRFMEG